MKIWHACPEWQAERFPWQTAFIAVPKFYLFFHNSFSILWRIRYVYTNLTPYRLNCHCYQIVLRVNHFFSGALRGVDWIFINGAPAWRWVGEYVSQSSFQTGSSSNYIYFQIFFLIPFLEEVFIINKIMTLCINYIIIIWIKDNNAVINNNCGRLQGLIMLCKISMFTRKYFFEIYRLIRHTHSKICHPCSSEKSEYCGIKLYNSQQFHA